MSPEPAEADTRVGPGGEVLIRRRGRNWIHGADGSSRGVATVLAGGDLTDLTVAELAALMPGRLTAAGALRDGNWADPRTLLVEIDQRANRLREYLADEPDGTLHTIRYVDALAGLDVLRAWVLEQAGGVVDDVPAGQLHNEGGWVYLESGIPVAIPTPGQRNATGDR